MSVLLFCCFLLSLLSVSSGRGESHQTPFAPYQQPGTSFTRLNSLLRLFSRMNQLAENPHPSLYGHPERERPYYYPSPMMPEYPMDYYPPVYPPADDVFYPNYPAPLFDQRYVGYPQKTPYGYGGMFGYDEDDFFADYLMSTLSQPIFNRKQFPKKFAAVYIPMPLRGPFGPQGLKETDLIGSLLNDAHPDTGVSIETNANAPVPLRSPATPSAVRS